MSQTNGVSEKHWLLPLKYIGTDFRKLQASSRFFKHTLDVSGVMKLAQIIYEHRGYVHIFLMTLMKMM